MIGSPRDLADRMTERNDVKKFIRETQRMPTAEARRHAKQIFEEFPSAEYLTEIESWRPSPGGTFVEWTVKRLEKPVSEAD